MACRDDCGPTDAPCVSACHAFRLMSAACQLVPRVVVTAATAVAARGSVETGRAQPHSAAEARRPTRTGAAGADTSGGGGGGRRCAAREVARGRPCPCRGPRSSARSSSSSSRAASPSCSSAHVTRPPTSTPTTTTVTVPRARVTTVPRARRSRRRPCAAAAGLSSRCAAGLFSIEIF
jgi:hypothetical protein